MQSDRLLANWIDVIFCTQKLDEIKFDEKLSKRSDHWFKTNESSCFFIHPNVINEWINASFFFYLFSIRFEVSMEQILCILHVITLNHPSNHWHSLKILYEKWNNNTNRSQNRWHTVVYKYMCKAQCCDHTGRICVDHVLLPFPINWINTKLASTSTKLNRFNNEPPNGSTIDQCIADYVRYRLEKLKLPDRERHR